MRKQKHVPNSAIDFVEMDGAKYQPESYESFDLAMCIGASFVYGGYRETMRVLKKMTKPKGLIAIMKTMTVDERRAFYADYIKG